MRHVNTLKNASILYTFDVNFVDLSGKVFSASQHVPPCGLVSDVH